MNARPTDDELRQMIRELLRELLPPALEQRRSHRPPVPDTDRPPSVPRTDALCERRVDARAVLERHVADAAEAGATVLVIGPRAVLTPLAKDKVRALGLTVRREG